MRKIQTTPKDRAFYNEHGASLKAYSTLANIGQLLSGLSLALAVFSILKDAIAGYGFTAASWLLTAAAILIGLFVELANRLLARPSIRPLVVRNQFTEDPEKRRRHILLTRLSRVGLLLVGSLSLFLSWRGSMDAGKLIIEEPTAINSDSLATSAAGQLQQIALAFSSDTAALLYPYTQRVAAANQQFTATAAERNKAAQDYGSCSRKGNVWCKKQQRAILGDIDAARATLAATLATIATERGATLAEAVRRRDIALRDATGRNDAALAEAKNTYATATGEATAKASSTGYIFAVLTLMGQVVFYLMTYLILQIKAGSEIEEDLQPNEFNAQPSVLADLRAVIDHRVERGARRLIRKVFGDRDRLTDALPYIHFWDAPTAVNSDPDPLATASADAPHAPGFYRAADDPHTKGNTPTSRAPFNTPGTQQAAVNTHTKTTAQTDEEKLAYSRLTQYRKRLGTQQQKAKNQERKTGVVSTRTAQAIVNNQQWVDHYTRVLNNLKR